MSVCLVELVQETGDLAGAHGECSLVLTWLVLGPGCLTQSMVLVQSNGQ